MVPPPDPDRVRAAEVVAALCLATDLGMGLPVEQGLQATVVAMRVAERLGVDEATARQTFFGCLLFYAGCTADAEIQAILFPRVHCWSVGHRSCSGVPGRRRSVS